MGKTKQSAAERNYKILAFLFASGKWENVRDIGLKLGSSQNYDRLKEDMDSLVKLRIIQNWDDLSELEKQNERKNKTNSKIKGKNNYKITDLGREKLSKIRDDCLDPVTKVILKMQRTKEDWD